MPVDSVPNEQPDVLLQRAWDSGADRMAVIRRGTDAAMLLLADRSETITLFWPVPRPLEPISHWSGNHREVNAIPERLRPFASAVLPACIVGYVFAKLVLEPRMSLGGGVMAMLGAIAVSFVAIGLLLALFVTLTLRSRIAKMTEEKAFAIVLAELRRGAAGAPKLVPLACERLRTGIPGFAG